MKQGKNFFYFTSKALRSWDNEILNFQIFSKKLFSKMYILVLCLDFDDVMKFENLKNLNLIFSRTKRAFQENLKAFFLVWEVLLCRLKKQTSKTVAGTIFNLFLERFDMLS